MLAGSRIKLQDSKIRKDHIAVTEGQIMDAIEYAVKMSIIDKKDDGKYGFSRFITEENTDSESLTSRSSRSSSNS